MTFEVVEGGDEVRLAWEARFAELELDAGWKKLVAEWRWARHAGARADAQCPRGSPVLAGCHQALDLDHQLC